MNYKLNCGSTTAARCMPTMTPKFIWLKAKKVWIAFIRRLPKQRSNLEISDLPENFASGSFLQDFESRDTVAVIESLLCVSEIELLRQRGQGIPYKEIPNYPSAAAAMEGLISSRS